MSPAFSQGFISNSLEQYILCGSILGLNVPPWAATFFVFNIKINPRNRIIKMKDTQIRNYKFPFYTKSLHNIFTCMYGFTFFFNHLQQKKKEISSLKGNYQTKCEGGTATMTETRPRKKYIKKHI